MSDNISKKEAKDNKEQEAEKLTIEKARSILLHHQPFFACMLQSCVFRWDESVGTAGVRVNSRGKVELSVSPKFWNSLDGNQGVGLLMHEMLHLLNEHLTRGINLNPYIANIAMDIAINQYIPKGWLPNGALLPKMKEQDTFQVKNKNGEIVNAPNPKAGNIIWDFSEKKAFEFYYAELLKIKDQIDQSNKNGKNQNTLDNHDWPEECGQQQSQEKEGQNKNSSGDDFKHGKKSNNEEGKVSEDVQKIAIDQLIRKAAEEAKSQYPGRTPSHIEQSIIDRFKPAKIDWRKALRGFIGKKYSRQIESTRTRPNRRFGYTMPGYRKTFTPNILIAVDCSGSISNEDYVCFMSEIKEILKGQDDKTEIIFFDSEIYCQKLKLSELKEMPSRKCWGGTSFQPVLDYANKLRPDLLIIFTDGDAASPNKSNFSVLWALIGSNKGEHLVGKKIFIENNKRSNN